MKIFQENANLVKMGEVKVQMSLCIP